MCWAHQEGLEEKWQIVLGSENEQGYLGTLISGETTKVDEK